MKTRAMRIRELTRREFLKHTAQLSAAGGLLGLLPRQKASFAFGADLPKALHWRIPEIRQQWASDRVRDSAVATGMKQSVTPSAHQRAPEASLPNPSAGDVD